MGWGLLVVLLSLCGSAAVHAQDKSASSPGAQIAGASSTEASTVQSSDVVKLFDDLDDIDHLRSLNPLKLSGEQLDQLITTIASAQTDYQKKLKAMAATHVRKRASEIRSVKKAALTGGEIPADFDKTMQQESVNYAKSIAALDLQNLQSLSTALRPILTAPQVKTAVRLAKEAPMNASKFGKGSDDQWFNMYVMQIIIGYPRIVPLMKEMRAAIGT